MKILKAGLAGLLLILSSCRQVPAVHLLSFTCQASLDKPTLYLDRKDQGSVTLQLNPSDEVAAAYQLVSFSCPEGSLLTDEKGEPVVVGMPVEAGATTWSYVPSSVGQHALVLVVADTYGDHTETCALNVTVRHHQEVDFALSLQAEEVQLFSCHQGRLTLAISSADPKARQQGYTMHRLHTSSGAGAFFLADGLTPLKAGDYVHFGEQSIVFVPGQDVEGTECITVVVGNEQGDLSEAKATLQLQKGQWLVSAKVRRVQRLAGGCGQVSVELAINTQDQALQDEQWQLSGWTLSGGLAGVLEDHKQEQLPVYPLKQGKNAFTLSLPPFALTALPLLSLTITGPGERSQPVEVSLVGSCAQLLEQQLAGLPQQMEAVARNAREALKGTPDEETLGTHYKTQLAAALALQEQLKSIEDNMAVLGHQYETAPGRATLQRLQQGAKKEMEEAVAALARATNHFQGLSRGINQPDWRGNLPLHEAAAAGDLALVRFLLPRTRCKNLENKQGQTPLDLAASYSEVAYLLTSRGVAPGIDTKVRARFKRAVNAYDRHGYTPLIEAIREKDEAGVRLLLQHPELEIDRGDFIKKDEIRGLTPLIHAASRGQVKIVKLLVKQGAEVNINVYYTWPVISLGRKRFRGGTTPREYLEHDKYNWTALLAANTGRERAAFNKRGSDVIRGYEEIDRYLLEHGAVEVHWQLKYYDEEYAKLGRQKVEPGDTVYGREVLRE